MGWKVLGQKQNLMLQHYEDLSMCMTLKVQIIPQKSKETTDLNGNWFQLH